MNTDFLGLFVVSDSAMKVGIGTGWRSTMTDWFEFDPERVPLQNLNAPEKKEVTGNTDDPWIVLIKAAWPHDRSING